MTITSGSYAPSVSAVSFSDSPLSTEEPVALTDITSAESRFAASSKLDEVRVEDSKKRLTTVRPRSVGSFFISRSRLRSKLRAVASSRSTSSRVRSRIEIRCRRGGGSGGTASARMTRISGLRPLVTTSLLFGGRDQEDLVDLVHLEELHLDALLARGREVLAHVVGADRQLAVAAVDEHGELDARGPAVVEQGVDRGADRAARVEDVVDEDDRAALEREVELRRADDWLRVQRRLAAAHLHVVAVEGDVDGAEDGRDAGALLDEPPEPLRERYPAGVDADERDLVEVGVPLDDLVGDPGERPVEGGLVHERLPGGAGRQRHATPFRPRWTGLKGFGSHGTLHRWADGGLAAAYDARELVEGTEDRQERCQPDQNAPNDAGAEEACGDQADDGDVQSHDGSDRPGTRHDL